jgi:hypothetical protein
MNEDRFPNGPSSGKKVPDWIVVVLCLLIPLGIVAAGYEYLVWSYYKTSAGFDISARSSILAMNQCADDIEKPEDASDACLRDARERLAEARAAAKTTADRGIYYQSLGPYLEAIEASRRDRELGDTSPQAKSRHDEIISRRNELTQWLNELSH